MHYFPVRDKVEFGKVGTTDSGRMTDTSTRKLTKHGGPACQVTAIEGAFPASLWERSWASACLLVLGWLASLLWKFCCEMLQDVHPIFTGPWTVASDICSSNFHSKWLQIDYKCSQAATEWPYQITKGKPFSSAIPQCIIWSQGKIQGGWGAENQFLPVFLILQSIFCIWNN